jgi:hypothetical protein
LKVHLSGGIDRYSPEIAEWSKSWKFQATIFESRVKLFRTGWISAVRKRPPRIRNLRAKCPEESRLPCPPRPKGSKKALETVQASPDIRSEKVTEIKSQIASNNYRVDSGALAEKILQEILTESQFVE